MFEKKGYVDRICNLFSFVHDSRRYGSLWKWRKQRVAKMVLNFCTYDESICTMLLLVYLLCLYSLALSYWSEKYWVWMDKCSGDAGKHDISFHQTDSRQNWSKFMVSTCFIWTHCFGFYILFEIDFRACPSRYNWRENRNSEKVEELTRYRLPRRRWGLKSCFEQKLNNYNLVVELRAALEQEKNIN